ncbi:MAG TPA: PIN domain-containing protein [Bryobacteraceae bacterium]|nr:PIN domain-containing protein [Bryobacteraceae bacterium]
MVLVDTSVWIRFFGGRAPYAAELEKLLLSDQVASHDLVYGELLIGDRGGRTRFLSEYALIPSASVVSHEEVVEFVRARALYGRGIGWVDVHLLASALVDRLRLWTADPRLRAVAEELAISY